MFRTLLLNKPNNAPPTTLLVVEIFSTFVEPQVGHLGTFGSRLIIGSGFGSGGANGSTKCSLLSNYFLLVKQNIQNTNKCMQNGKKGIQNINKCIQNGKKCA